MKFLFVIAISGCAVDLTPSESQDSSALVKPESSQFCSNGIEPARCDGMSWSDGDQYCNFVCIIAGDVGGWCRHINPNDAYHGICIGGFPP